MKKVTGFITKEGDDLVINVYEELLNLNRYCLSVVQNYCALRQIIPTMAKFRHQISNWCQQKLDKLSNKLFIMTS